MELGVGGATRVARPNVSPGPIVQGALWSTWKCRLLKLTGRVCRFTTTFVEARHYTGKETVWCFQQFSPGAPVYRLSSPFSCCFCCYGNDSPLACHWSAVKKALWAAEKYEAPDWTKEKRTQRETENARERLKMRARETESDSARERPKCARERPKMRSQETESDSARERPKGKSSNTQLSKTPINNRDIKAEVQKEKILRHLNIFSKFVSAGLTAVILLQYKSHYKVWGYHKLCIHLHLRSSSGCIFTSGAAPEAIVINEDLW